jgi:TIR domain
VTVGTCWRPEAPGRIFVSYRREDTAYPAGWLYDRLVRHFGRQQVFKDIDSIALGDDFPEVIANAVGSCDVLLALIGGRWLTSVHGDQRCGDRPRPRRGPADHDPGMGTRCGRSGSATTSGSSRMPS